MMKRLRLLLFALLFAFTLHAHANGQSVQFIITGDLHGQLKPLSQLAALFRKYPDAVKIDLGDLFQGEPAHDISNGEVMIDALNALKYDFIIPGNHDFELSAGQFTRSYSRFSGTLLGQWRCGKLPVFPWKIIERNKFKCAVIGMTDNGMYKIRRFFPGYSFEDELPSINAALKEISRHRVDIIILARHGGDYFHGMAAGKFLHDHPEIDMLFCAHTHREIAGQRNGRSLIVQPGAYGASAVLVTVKHDPVHGKIITSRLLRPAGKPDAQLAALNARMRAALAQRLYTPAITVRDHDDFIRRTLKKLKTAAGADAAVIDSPELKRGNHTLNKMLKLFPYRNRLCVITVSRKDFLAFLREKPPRNRRRYATPVPAGKTNFTLVLSSFQLNRSKRLKKYAKNVRLVPFVDRDIIFRKDDL